MHVDRDRLIFMALRVLDEAVDESRFAPVAPSAALRLALAFLHAVGDGDAKPYVDFWNTVRDPQAKAYSEYMGHVIRGTHAQGKLRRIIRAHGLHDHQTVTLLDDVRPRRPPSGTL